MDIIIIYQIQSLTEGRLIGIALAFVALFCLLWKADGGKKSGGLGTQIMLLAGVWAGYGIIDILFKQLAKSGTAFSGNLLVAFSLAGIFDVRLPFLPIDQMDERRHYRWHHLGRLELRQHRYLHHRPPNDERQPDAGLRRHEHRRHRLLRDGRASCRERV